MARLINSLFRQLDVLALHGLSRRIPDTLAPSYRQALPLTEVLAATRVDTGRTAVSNLTAPGEHPVWLDSLEGRLQCQVRVRLAADPAAPLLLHHHGLNEYPYTSSWRRLFPRNEPVPVHTVCVQAPYHDNWRDPLDQGMATVQRIYQVFSGSMRLLALMQAQFEAAGAPYTVAAGVSWGGITVLLYDAFFQSVRAVVPMLSSPNLARTLWDTAALIGRPIDVPRAELDRLLDFTPYLKERGLGHIYPLLGEQDRFFPLDRHAAAFGGREVATMPGSHVTGGLYRRAMRRHVLGALEREGQPLTIYLS